VRTPPAIRSLAALLGLVAIALGGLLTLAAVRWRATPRRPAMVESTVASEPRVNRGPQRVMERRRAPPPPAPRHLARRAVIVGINDYTSDLAQRGRAAGPWFDLRGPVNDALAMEELLRHQYGFEPAGLLVLVDGAATGQAILDALRGHLLAGARPGDELVFFYSGHGSQVPNPASDEDDHLDESLVPADANRGAEYLRDKVLARIYNGILDQGARLTVIVDSCYGGGATRGLPPPARARFLPPAQRGVVDGAPTGGRPEDRGALVLAAAQDFELAIEAEDAAHVPHGAFSLALATAMRRSLPGEPAEETFLRARGLLQMGDAFQQPVLAGTAERRRAPLFGRGATPDGAPLAVAVQSVEPRGRIVLQGGWAHGLNAGVELEVGGDDGGAPAAAVRLRVTRVLGPAKAEAVVEDRAAVGSRRIASGDLARLVSWVAEGPSLRVWVPAAGDRWPRVLAWARRLRALTGDAGVGWLADAVATAPTHVVHWDNGWWLTPRGQASRFLGDDPDPRSLVRELAPVDGRPRRLFVQLPVPPALAAGLRVGAGTEHDAVGRSPSRTQALYQLMGRLDGEQIDFAWARPDVGTVDAPQSPLPQRSDWHPLRERGCAAALTDVALRLNKLYSWLTLESPPWDSFPYHLFLVDEAGGFRRGGQLRAGESYKLAVRSASTLAGLRPRYLYVFTIDSFGSSTLLFPRGAQGSVENRYPLVAAGSPWPAEIELTNRPAFRVSEPFGVDTFFLLSSEEPIANPWVVQFPGARSRGPRGSTQLEELLSQTGSATRGVAITGLPPSWSLERLSLDTVP
jgi:caspase domain-containing protein